MKGQREAQEPAGEESLGNTGPVSRNLANIWAKYPQYQEENTIVVSNFYNLIEDFQRNDIVIPTYDPKLGSTDFLDDMHLTYFVQYLSLVQSLDATVGHDIRMRMEGLGYDQFCQRITKSLRADQRKHQQDEIF
mmetsp:Transcript_1618/g.2862  ORF Transcript_1618/g.2862 Transcript_1618/m.2862 type:complete len:134 (+) Transcript_1618:358-759(+)